jgi:hypothetical protein
MDCRKYFCLATDHQRPILATNRELYNFFHKSLLLTVAHYWMLKCVFYMHSLIVNEFI